MLSGKRILVVEDNFLVSEDLQQLVRDAHGDPKRAVGSSKEAIAALDREHFDGALLDVQLQDGTCIEIARQLSRRNIPFVIVSGYSRDWLAPELRNAPYIAKPYQRDELIDLAARHFTT